MHCNTILIIEVPSANDILINKYNCESFKKFTFWSEHLCLYTNETLLKILQKAIFTNITIDNEQRYNIFNHLYWITHDKPGGHNIWNSNEQNLIAAYNDYLKSNNYTDTLLAYCVL